MNNTFELKEKIKEAESLIDKTSSSIKELDDMIKKLKAFMKESEDNYYIYRPYVIKALNLRCDYIDSRNRCIEERKILIKQLERGDK